MCVFITNLIITNSVSCWECHKDALAFQEETYGISSCSGFSDSSPYTPTCLLPAEVPHVSKNPSISLPLWSYLRGFGTSLAAIPMTWAGWLLGWLLVWISGSAI